MAKQRVLVLCTGNSCRSQMAAGWLTALYGEQIEAFSAGSRPAGYVHPKAVAVMAEAGVDIGGGRSKSVSEFAGQSFDTVLTVCDTAAETCPVFPGRAQRVHHDFPDPAKATGSDAEVLDAFRRTRDDIRAWLVGLFGEGEEEEGDNRGGRRGRREETGLNTRRTV